MNKININNLIYSIALFLFVGSNLLCNVKYLMPYLLYFKLFAYVLFFINGTMLLLKGTKIKFKTLLMIFLSLFIGGTTYCITKNSLLLDLFFVLYASVKNNFYNILKIDLLVKIIITIIILMSYINGQTISRFLVTRDNEYIRSSFGFYHPNTFGMYIMMIYFEFVVLSKKIKFKNILVGIITIFIIYFTSNSRTAYFTITIFLIFYLMLWLASLKGGKLKFYNFKLNNYLFPILTILSLIFTKLYDLNLPIALKLDEFLSRRLYLQSINMKQFPITILGNNITFIRTLDNGFLKVLLNYGIVSTMIYLVIFYINFKSLKEDENNILTVIMFSLLYYTLSESNMLYIYLNIFLLYFFCKRNEIKLWYQLLFQFIIQKNI